MENKNRYDEIPFADEGFPIKILWELQPVLTERNKYENTWHEQLEILFFIDGVVEVECGFKRILAEGGDIIIVNPCEAHSVYYRSGAPKYHCIMIDPALYASGSDLINRKYIEPMSKRRLHFNNLIRDNKRVKAILEELLRECHEKRSAYEIAVKGDILLLLAELFRNELRAVYSEDEILRLKRGYEQIAPALRLIADNYSRELTLGELAHECMLDSSYFCRRFKAITSKKVFEYINEYRIAKADALLLSTDMSVSRVAITVGFSDSNYFSRQYKKLRGFPPSQKR
ncbi:MAG: AraC family transcriptional regulator [Eubacteriales bacterium]